MSCDTNNKIASFSFVCALMVVLIHCGTPVRTTGLPVAFHHYVVRGLCEIANPFFFVLSGYFVGKHIGEQGWWIDSLRKRILTIVVPYLIWEFAFVTYAGLWQPFGLLRLIDILGLEPRRWPMLVPLWYLRALVIYICFLPCFVWLSRACKGRVFWFVMSAIVYLINYYVRTKMNPNTGLPRIFFHSVNLAGLSYFLLGVGININRLRFNIRDSGGLLLIILGSLFFCIDLGYVAVPVFLLGLWSLWPAVKLPKFLEGASFPLYLMHVFVITEFNRILGLRWDDYSVSIAACRWTTAVAISLLIVLLLKRLFPRFSRILFGGRL